MFDFFDVVTSTSCGYECFKHGWKKTKVLEKALGFYFFIYIFIHTECNKKKQKKMISKNKDALSVSGALVARRLK